MLTTCQCVAQAVPRGFFEAKDKRVRGAVVDEVCVAKTNPVKLLGAGIDKAAPYATRTASTS
eukprot:4601616-Lingulodinium_polyedra.AAC.1